MLRTKFEHQICLFAVKSICSQSCLIILNNLSIHKLICVKICDYSDSFQNKKVKENIDVLIVN